jgi:glyoxylase-like metal-dependent hydrolase (beta-lactamase superfamily II)
MAIGDVTPVESVDDVYCVNVGGYDTDEYVSVYVVDAERPAVLDTGIGTHYDRVTAAIESVGLEVSDLEVIAPSHAHLDHAGGAGFLAADAPDAAVYVHEIGAPHLSDPGALVEGTKRAAGELWQYYLEPEPVPEDRIVELTDGDTIDLGDRTLEVHHAPGHAPHQVVYHEPAANWVHTGDAAGVWVPARQTVREVSPPPDFDFEQALSDVEMIENLSAETLLYGHYGPVTDVDIVLDIYRETLTGFVEEVARVREETSDEDAVIEHFLDLQTIDAVWPELKAHEETRMNVEGVLGYLERRER